MHDSDEGRLENKKEQIANILSQTTRTRVLNDQFRCGRGEGQHFITPGIQEMGLGRYSRSGSSSQTIRISPRITTPTMSTTLAR